MLSPNDDVGYTSQPIAKFDHDIIRTSKSMNKVGMGANRAADGKQYQRMGNNGFTKSQQLSMMPRK